MFRRRRSPGVGILFLAAQLFQIGFQHIPPVTLGIIALNTAIYLRILNGLPSIRQACISFVHVWYREDWKRIFLSPFFHLDDMHLYYNMVSFVWKGRSLETRIGSAAMFFLISVFSILTSVTLLVLDKCFSVFLNDLSYLHTCAAGFSGVIFALKVVTTYHLPPGMTNVFMFSVPSRIACWIELVIIQLLVPSSSFTGHLAGILVGLLYVKGPLKQVMDSIGNVFQPHPVRPSYTYNSARSGYSGRRALHDAQTADEDEDIELQAALQQSLNEMRQHQDNTQQTASQTRTHTNSEANQENRLTDEDIRQRRLRRFQT